MLVEFLFLFDVLHLFLDCLHLFPNDLRCFHVFFIAIRQRVIVIEQRNANVTISSGFYLFHPRLPFACLRYEC